MENGALRTLCTAFVEQGLRCCTFGLRPEAGVVVNLLLVESMKSPVGRDVCYYPISKAGSDGVGMGRCVVRRTKADGKLAP